MTKQYIKLPGISNQKIRQKYYTPESIAHPAKANIPMMIWILKNFVQDGDIVLDPMAGILTTGIEGMRLFPNSIFIGVELEDKFVKMAQANIKKVKKIGKKDMFLKIGKAVCVKGNARDLEKILKEKVNKIITSPPFADSKHNYKHGLKELGKNFRGRRAWETKGQVNKIISSPPFGQAQSGGGIAKKGYDGPKHTPTDMVGKRSYMPENIGGKENIGNLPYGQADKIISSPPYAERYAYKNPEKEQKNDPYASKRNRIHKPYSQNPNNIGNLNHDTADKIVTSKTYLSEMLKIYRECLKILKPGGLMILITKDFIRDKKRVLLGEDTIKLCQAAGFVFREIYYRKIEHPSFWRILYQQKHPEVEKIDSEDILIFEKKN